jgi:hypothetical protein
MTEMAFDATLVFESTAADFLSSNVSQQAAISAFAESLGNVSSEDVAIMNVTDITSGGSDRRRQLSSLPQIDVSFLTVVVLEKMGVTAAASTEIFTKMSSKLVDSVSTGSFGRSLQRSIQRLDSTNSTKLTSSSAPPKISQPKVVVVFTASPSSAPSVAPSAQPSGEFLSLPLSLFSHADILM